MKKTLLYLIPLVAMTGLGALYFTNNSNKLDEGTYIGDVNVSYQNIDDVRKIVTKIYVNTTTNKKIRILYNNDYFVLDNSLFSIDLESTMVSFYEGTKNKIFINVATDELLDDISSYFSIDLSGIDTYRLIKDIQNDYFSMNLNSYYELSDYIKEDIYKESYRKVASIVINPENPELIYEATGGKIMINGLSRFSYLDFFKEYEDVMTAKDLSLFASALNSLVIRTDTSSFIRTNTYESPRSVDSMLKPHMVYVSYNGKSDASFYNNSEDDIIINVTRPTKSKIGLELFLKESQEFSKLEVNNKTVRFDYVFDTEGYKDKENGEMYYVYKIKVVDEKPERVHVYDTYYLPVGVKSNE